MAKYKIIVNPISGRGNGERSIPQIDNLLTQYGLDYDLTLTERPLHAVELAREAAMSGFDVVVAAGGDGTYNEVLNGLMEAKKAGADSAAMGVFSIGRGNDFSYGAEIPGNLEECCKVLAEDHRRAIDIGYVVGGDFPEGRYFDNCVGIGFDALGGIVAEKLYPLSGFLNYIVAVVLTVFVYYKPLLLTIEYDGKKMTIPSLMVSIMNGKRLGGGFYMAPDAEMDDGLFDLCIASAVSRLRILTLVPHFTKGTQATQKEIQILRASRITVTALEGSLPAHLDGETLCKEGQKVEVELLPRKIEIVCRAPDSTPTV